MRAQIAPLLMLAALAGGAQAQATRMMMPEGTADMVFGLAMQRTFFAASEGGPRSIVVPTLEVQWSNGVFAEVNTEEAVLGVHLSDDPMLDYGLLALANGRDQRSDTPGQRGGVALQAGGFVNWNVANNISLGANLMAGGGIDGGGLLANLRARIYHRLAPRHGARFHAGLMIADRTWQQGYFGVSAAQAANGGNPAYRAGAGLVNVYGDAEWHWHLSNKVFLSSGVRLSRLARIAAASPLTDKRQRISTRIALSYRF